MVVNPSNSASRAPRNAAEGAMHLSILGATGSIGTSTLEVVAASPERFRIEALTAAGNVDKLADLARRFGAKLAVIADPALGGALAERLAGSGIAAAAGPEAIVEAASRPVDVVVSAIVGAAGLAPSLAAACSARAVALANKETLVSAGALFMATAAARGTTILPVDSEHNALFQVFEDDNAAEVAEIIVTASGGPFLRTPAEALARVTRAEALRHPKWVMGPKITIDSATLMNKGLEVIEAFHLYPVGADQLSVLVHPQSVVHGLVRYTDGSLLAELGTPDMRTPIAYCLAWPERRPSQVRPLDLAEVGTLTFEKPDRRRFRCLAIAEAALARGDGATCVLNAANEIAVEAFLADAIGFLDIAAVVEDTLEVAERLGLFTEPRCLADALALDGASRRLAGEAIARRAG